MPESSPVASEGSGSALRRLRRAHHHDLRGELNALRLQLTLLRRGSQDPASVDPQRMARWLGGAEQQAKALELGLDDLAGIDKLEQALEGSTLGDMVQHVARLAGPLATRRRVQLDASAVEPPVTPAVESDAGGLGRWLLSLCCQCLLRAEPGTVLHLLTSADGIELRVATQVESTTDSDPSGFPFEPLPDGLDCHYWSARISEATISVDRASSAV